MPGLIDAHVHAVEFEPSPGAGGTSPYYRAGRAYSELANMLTRGFTTVRDAAGADAGMARAVREGHVPGPRLLTAGRAISQTGGHGDGRSGDDQGAPGLYSMLGRIADGVPEVLAAVRDELRRGADQIKVMAGGGIDSPSDHVMSWQYTEAELAAAVDAATAAGTYVMAHAYNPASIQRAVAAGVRSIEHGNLADIETLTIMREAGTFLVPTLAVYDCFARGIVPTGADPGEGVSFDEILNAGLRALELAHQVGVPIVFGTDLCEGAKHLQLHEFRLRSEVVPHVDVLRSATTHAAALIGRSHDLGRVAVGSVADLLVMDADPFGGPAVMEALPEHICYVLKDGAAIPGALSSMIERRAA